MYSGKHCLAPVEALPTDVAKHAVLRQVKRSRAQALLQLHHRTAASRMGRAVEMMTLPAVSREWLAIFSTLCERREALMLIKSERDHSNMSLLDPTAS